MDAAFRWLERGFDERAAGMRSSMVTPAFDAPHVEPRWGKLLGRLDLRP